MGETPESLRTFVVKAAPGQIREEVSRMKLGNCSTVLPAVNVTKLA
jgi:hypothetical protein